MARLTKRSYKRKRIAIGLTLFASVALVSTGFAAWIVSSTARQEGNGSVSMGQITDAALKIEIQNKDNLGSFTFGPLANDKRGLVKYDEREGESENLSITINGTFENAQYLNNLTIKLDEVLGEGQASRIQAAVDAGYIVAPACFTEEVTIITNGAITQVGEENAKTNMPGVTYSQAGTNATFSYTISFEWGSKFEGVNPGCYFDREKYNVNSDTWTPIVEDTLNPSTDGYYDGVADPATELLGLWNVLHGTSYTTIAEQLADVAAGTSTTPSFKVSLEATVK